MITGDRIGVGVGRVKLIGMLYVVRVYHNDGISRRTRIEI